MDEDRTAREIAEGLGQLIDLHRFPTGLCHYVYDVELVEGPVVLRLAAPENRHLLASAVRLSDLLRPRGVPLPEVLHRDPDYLVLERLPGRDLGDVYADLTPADRKALAQQIAEVQARVHGLGEGQGFGYVTDPEGPFPHATWGAVIGAHLQRSEDRLSSAGVIDPAVVDRVRSTLPAVADYFAAVRPTPFLDDTTTKNVIVHEGRLSGIVDVDLLCFGDPLYPVALTRMSLLASRNDPEYVEHWLDALGATHEQRRVLDVYTAVFCVDFLSELGTQFNREDPQQVDDAQSRHLLVVLDSLLRAQSSGHSPGHPDSGGGDSDPVVS